MSGPDMNSAYEPGRSALRRNGFLLAGGFLVLVLVLAVTVIVTGQQSDPPPPATSPSAAAPPTQAADGCRPTDTSQHVPTAPPAGVSWQVFNTIAVPSSPTAGPLIVQGGVARCYAHTPAGALLAVAQIPNRISLASDWERVLAQQVLPSAGRDLFQRRRSKITAPLNFSSGGFAQTAGFRFVTYTAQTAVVQLVTRSTDGGLGVYTITVMWADGDWKLQMQPNGSSSTPPQSISSLEGFAAWGGV
jgi:hypothetical protein